MSQKIYSIKLNQADRQQLWNYVKQGERASRTITRARILLLADEQMSDEEIGTVLEVSRTTVYRVRKSYRKNELNPGLIKRGCLGKITGDFIWHMEDILDLYEQPYDPCRPTVCFDERPCQLIDEVLVPLPMKPGRAKYQDDE